MSTTSLPDFAAINAAFQALSPGEKRRAIAREVLSRLDSGQFRPARGFWVVVRDDSYITSYAQNSDDRELQAVLAGGTVCETCAIGAAICAVAHFEDNMPVSRALFRHVQDRLFDLLGEKQTRLMECAFEAGGGEGLASGLDLQEDAITFGDRYPDHTNRFRAIWTAIAEHPEGLFDVVALNAAAAPKEAS